MKCPELGVYALPGPECELYDMTRDPGERRNLWSATGPEAQQLRPTTSAHASLEPSAAMIGGRCRG